MYTNAGFDMAALAAEQKQREELHTFLTLHNEAEARAVRDTKGFLKGGTPEVLTPDSEALARREWTFDDSSGKDAREVSEIRNALAYGKLQPKAFVDHGTHVEYVFDNDHVLNAFAEGRACIRCREVPKQTRHEQLELHERLQRQIRASGAGYEYEIPNDVMGHCGYCGAVIQAKAA